MPYRHVNTRLRNEYRITKEIGAFGLRSLSKLLTLSALVKLEKSLFFLERIAAFISTSLTPTIVSNASLSHPGEITFHYLTGRAGQAPLESGDNASNGARRERRAYKYMHIAMVRHGSVFQVIDPWKTSWYAYWSLTMPRDIILGDTVGEAYVKGMSHVGILYLGDNGGPPQWWWDSAENVVYFGDPDLRMYVPDNDYSDANTWERPQALVYDPEIEIDGHMPYGSTSYPHKMESRTFFEKIIWFVAAIIIILIGLAIAIIIKKKQPNKKKKNK